MKTNNFILLLVLTFSNIIYSQTYPTKIRKGYFWSSRAIRYYFINDSIVCKEFIPGEGLFFRRDTFHAKYTFNKDTLVMQSTFLKRVSYPSKKENLIVFWEGRDSIERSPKGMGYHCIIGDSIFWHPGDTLQVKEGWIGKTITITNDISKPSFVIGRGETHLYLAPSSGWLFFYKENKEYFFLRGNKLIELFWDEDKVYKEMFVSYKKHKKCEGEVDFRKIINFCKKRGVL